MDLPILGEISEYIPIPEIFHSFLYEGMFSECCVCDIELLHDGTGYIIEKAFKGDEVIFEYAMCNVCRMDMYEELSKKSLTLIEHYFDERINLVERRQDLLEGYDQSIEPWIDKCILSGKPRMDCDGYQIYADCDGGDLLFSYLPYIISCDSIDEIQELLSLKTRDRLDGFIRDVLNSPFDFKDMPVFI